jgi:hypothetical protein
MSLVISKVFTYDTDAGNYIQAVEAADGQALEAATRQAINNFVVGCKQDGIWSAIKASCILAGARTLNGALVPLLGTAPTNNGPFVAGDYNRKTGLVGNGSTKYLDSNRADNADPQSNVSICFYSTTAGAITGGFIGASTTHMLHYLYRLRTGASVAITMASPGFIGAARTSAGTTQYRNGKLTLTSSDSVTATPGLDTHLVFARRVTGSVDSPTAARLAFYSIGEAIDLAKLDTRVTDLITAFGAAIP